MDAYELAEGLDKFSDLGGKFFCESANMLRQQADRIAELEKQQSAEPVVWMSPDSKFSKTEGKLFYIPLYITPQIKELSDEEINAVYHEVWNSNKWSDVEGIDIEKFAKAILKKANEK